ncbi:hypothetical protein [Catenulispora subtropica]|uniref:Secreted protein n=1 Tax=Catenulispora subtropica TaxID=450798 RepID=A0ABP5C2E6_9ACTN
MRKSKKLAAVTLALGAALVGSVTPAAATGGAQQAACTSSNYNTHVVWFKLTKTDGTTFCVGGGTGTVSLDVDINKFDSFGVDTTSPTTRYYGYLDTVDSGGFAGKTYVGDWPSMPELETDWWSFTLPCPVMPPPYTGFCPFYGSSAHVTGVEIVGSVTG